MSLAAAKNIPFLYSYETKLGRLAFYSIAVIQKLRWKFKGLCVRLFFVCTITYLNKQGPTKSIHVAITVGGDVAKSN